MGHASKEMMTELNPCPFCGGNDIRFIFQKGHGDLHEYAFGGFECGNPECGVCAHWCLADADEWNEKNARKICVERWNRRADNAG